MNTKQQTRPQVKKVAWLLLSDCVCQNHDIVMEWHGDQVREMVAEWCDIKCGAIVVCERNDWHKYEVLDGVKRLTAARMRQIPFIPVVVVTGP